MEPNRDQVHSSRRTARVGRALTLALAGVASVGGCAALASASMLPASLPELDSSDATPPAYTALSLPDLDLLEGEAIGRLIHGVGHAGHRGTLAEEEGAIFGVDIGGAFPIAGATEARDSVAFGGRVGYQFRDGIALQARFDSLGVTQTLINNSQLMFATIGMRYTFPFLFPLPFVEAMIGPSFVNSSPSVGQVGASEQVDFGAGVGLGASFLLSRHVSIDVSAHDWLSPVGGSLLQVLTVQAGVSLSVGGPPSR